MVTTSGEKVKREIVKLLEKHPEGLTIKEISEKLNLHRQTVTKYVLELKGAGAIIRKRVGSATLHYLKEKFVQKVMEEKILEKLRKKLA